MFIEINKKQKIKINKNNNNQANGYKDEATKSQSATAETHTQMHYMVNM